MNLNVESNPLLTITIASVSIRKSLLALLLKELKRQIQENNLKDEIEILVDDDDDRFLGTKRKEMVAKAKGLFTCAIDDDDWISDDYITLIVNALKKNPNVDCLGIEGLISFNGLESKKWKISCAYEDWYEDENYYYRTPNHICPIKTEFVKTANFDDVAWGEDYSFSKRIKQYLKNEIRINTPIYYYQYDSNNSLYNYQDKKQKT
jgi:hypothetical protein